jgi:hypothetical protein
MLTGPPPKFNGTRDTVEEPAVPIFVVERNYAEELDPSLDIADGINRINAKEGVRWLYSFLSADRVSDTSPTQRKGGRPSERLGVCGLGVFLGEVWWFPAKFRPRSANPRFSALF